MLGYRTTHVDVMPLNGEKFGNAKGTLSGVEQVGNFDPYVENRFHTSAWQGGIEVKGLGNTVTVFNRGDWIGVSGVNFSKGASSITINGGSQSGATLRISTDSPTGPVIGYVSVPAGENKESTAEVKGPTGVKNIFFVASGDCSLNTYKFS